MGTEISVLPPSSIDRRLLKAAAAYQTGEQMSEAVLGRLTPAQCVERVHELLSQKTILDEVEERRLVLIQIAEWVDWIKGKRDNEKSWPVIARSLKVLSDQVERSNINITDVSSKLAENHARYMVDAVSLGFERIIQAIMERDDIVIEEEDITELIEVGVLTSAEYIDRVTAKGEDAV